jgi:hypothetical protein
MARTIAVRLIAAVAVLVAMPGVASDVLRAQQGTSASRPASPVFRIGVGPSVAASGPQSRTGAVMAVRTEGCADTATVNVTGTAEGLVGSERQSLPLYLHPSGPHGVYGVEGRWPAEGAWVLSFKGTCGRSEAGTVVPVRGGQFVREGVVYLTHPPAPAEVDASLKTLAATMASR